MKKFTKITENKQFLGYSKDGIFDEFKSHLDPKYLNIDMLYVSIGKDGSDIITDTAEINKHNLEDKIFAPMFYIDLVLGVVPEDQNHHEIDGVQVDNWVDESIKFELISNEFIKLSSFLERYKDDFNISLETSGGNVNGKARERSNSFISYDRDSKKRFILNITLSLTMKDYFEPDQIR